MSNQGRLKTVIYFGLIVTGSSMTMGHSGKAYAADSAMRLSNTNQCLDVHEPDYRAGRDQNKDGLRIQQWACNGWDNQKWQRVGTEIRSKNGKCLDLHMSDYDSRKAGGKVHLWGCSGGPNQQWVVDGDKLRVKDTNLCLDVHSTDFDNATNGGAVHVWGCGAIGKANQSWTAAFIDGLVSVVNTPTENANPFVPVNVSDQSNNTQQVNFASSGASLPHWNTCRSDGTAKACFVLTNDRVIEARLVPEITQGPCREGTGWGSLDNQIWVNNGCGGNFNYALASDGAPAPADNPPPVIEPPPSGNHNMVEPPIPGLAGATNKYGQILGSNGFPVGKDKERWSIERESPTTKPVATSPGHANNLFEPGSFRDRCYFSHMAQIDPILAPGKDRSMHLHTFFGNTGVNKNSNPNNMRGDGRSSTCVGGTHNLSSYWIPTLMDADRTAIAPKYGFFYYKSGFEMVSPIDANSLQAHNRRIRKELPKVGTVSPEMNSEPEGNNKPEGYYHSRFPDKFPQYTCKRRNPLPADVVDNDVLGKRNQFISATLPGLSSDWELCNSRTSYLVLDVRFYQCWNTNDKGKLHSVFKDVDRDSHSCPTGHEMLPAIQYRINYDLPAGTNFKDLYLSSDRKLDVSRTDSRGDGSSLHGDWLNGWKPETSKLWLQHCVRDGMSCTHQFKNNQHSANLENITHSDKRLFGHAPHSDWLMLGADDDRS